MVLCALHHRALDRYRIGIKADTLEVAYKPGFRAETLLVEHNSLTHLKRGRTRRRSSGFGNSSWSLSKCRALPPASH